MTSRLHRHWFTYPLGYGPTLTNACTGVVLIFDQLWFSSNIELPKKFKYFE